MRMYSSLYPSKLANYANSILSAKVETPCNTVSLNYVNFVLNFKVPSKYKHELSGNILAFKHSVRFGEPEFIEIVSAYSFVDIFGFILRSIRLLLAFFCLVTAVLYPFSAWFFFSTLLISLSRTAPNSKSQYLFSKNCLQFIFVSLTGKSQRWNEQ
eukprot:NODE_95_length_21460_cov_0.300220.p16 type:complete len:156 gc:universal NODE_95_length_21460_cov_0.300220:1531-1998(+)